jgi:hypothetical protein
LALHTVVSPDTLQFILTPYALGLLGHARMKTCVTMYLLGHARMKTCVTPINKQNTY